MHVIAMCNCVTCRNKKIYIFYNMLCKYCALSLVLMQLANSKLSVAECGVDILCLFKPEYKLCDPPLQEYIKVGPI